MKHKGIQFGLKNQTGKLTYLKEFSMLNLSVYLSVFLSLSLSFRLLTFDMRKYVDEIGSYWARLASGSSLCS